jgi:CHASE2 domain-containing sensor protein
MKNRGKFIFYLALSAIVIGVKLGNYESLELMELRLQDALYDFKQSSSPSQKVALVTIDEVSLKSIGSWPWKSEVVADLVAAVGAGEPRTTLVDFPLSENSASGAGAVTTGKQTARQDYKNKSHKPGGSGSSLIAEQFEWMDNVTVAYNVIPGAIPNDTVANTQYLYRNALMTDSDLGRLEDDQALSVKVLAMPKREISNVAKRLGFTYLKTDADDVLRSEPLVMNYNGYYYPSAALSAAAHYLRVLPENITVNGGVSVELMDRTIPTTAHGEMLLNFPAEGSGFEVFSATDVLNERVKPGLFKDRLVIITLANAANTEYYKSPVSEELPHYMKTAIAVDNILNEEYLRRADSQLGLYILVLAAIGLLCAFALQMISSLYRIILVALALVALANVNFFLFNSFHLMANSLYVALQLVLFLVATPLTGLDYSFITKRFKKKTDEELLAELTPAEDESDLKKAGWNTRRKRKAKAHEPIKTSSGEIAPSYNATMAFAGAENVDPNATMVASSNADEAVKTPDAANETMIFGERAQEPEQAAEPIAEEKSASETPEKSYEAYGEISSDGLDESYADANDSASDHSNANDPGVISLDESIHPPADQSAAPEAPEQQFDRTSVYNANQAASSSEEPATPIEEDVTLFGDGIIKVGETDTPITSAPEAPADNVSNAHPSDPEPVSPTPELQAADGNLGRYELKGILGKGAMGLVYRGVDPVINRTVALKTIRLDFLTDPAEIAEMKERLFLEAQAAGKLSHPNIVTIYDVGEESSVQYIAMECLEGQTLEDMIKRKVNFNFKILARMIHQICSALQYAHDQGIVHRDIKPANIMVLPDYSIKVMDFGIARVESSSMTKTGVAMGTPNYISPEQLSGGKVDGRSDLFSLGVMFYEMLLGQRPFTGDNLTALIYSIMNKEPEAPSKVNPRVPPLFDMIIQKALQKDQAKRYQKASDMANALKDFVQSFATR